MVGADALPVSIGPRRIVCLTEEPTETLYALGEADRAVALSELSYLLNDNVEVITAPPQPEV